MVTTEWTNPHFERYLGLFFFQEQNLSLRRITDLDESKLAEMNLSKKFVNNKAIELDISLKITKHELEELKLADQSILGRFSNCNHWHILVERQSNPSDLYFLQKIYKVGKVACAVMSCHNEQAMLLCDFSTGSTISTKKTYQIPVHRKADEWTPSLNISIFYLNEKTSSKEFVNLEKGFSVSSGQLYQTPLSQSDVKDYGGINELAQYLIFLANRQKEPTIIDPLIDRFKYTLPYFMIMALVLSGCIYDRYFYNR